LGDGTTLKEHIMRSGYSSRILEIKSVPIPAPVPPPREWVIWKPIRSTNVSHLLREDALGTRTLQAVATLGLLPHNVEHRVDELGTFGVMAFCPIVTGPRLSEDEVVRTDEVAERGGSEGVHGARFEIDEDGAGDILVGWLRVRRQRWFACLCWRNLPPVEL
jgi:hypothetical protein